MSRCRNIGRVAQRTSLLLTATLVSACAGLEPFEPRNHRVEGPERGLFSGEAGEFVIFRREGVGSGQHLEASDEASVLDQVGGAPSPEH